MFLVSSEMDINSELENNVDSTFKRLFDKTYKYNQKNLESELYKIADEINLKMQEDFSYIINDEVSNMQVSPVNMQNMIELIQPYFMIDGQNVGTNIGSGKKRQAIYRMLSRLTMQESNEKYIILIDEPELHAHPSLVRKFCSELKNLAKAGHLVIVTTHSERVIEYIYTNISQIAKLKKTAHNATEAIQINLDEYMKLVKEYYLFANIMKLPNGKYNNSLENILHKNLYEFSKSILRERTFKMLFADVLVLGEGVSEEILFDYMFTNTFCEYFYVNNVDYLSVFGKFYMPFYFILANLYKIKCVCMYDVDNLENIAHKAYHESFLEYESNYKELFSAFPLVKDLEEELKIAMPSHRIEKPLNIFSALNKDYSEVERLARLLKDKIMCLLL